MLDYAELFKGVIPLEILGRYPLRFVHVLRDIRLKQREEKAKMMNGNGRVTPTAPSSGSMNALGIPSTALEDLIEELS